jgi:hypothetical protein
MNVQFYDAGGGLAALIDGLPVPTVSAGGPCPMGVGFAGLHWELG